MFQRLAQFCIALLDFLKQPHVLDGDDGLVGEGFEERNLPVSKRLDFHSANQDSPDRKSLTKQRHGKRSSMAEPLLRSFNRGKLGLHFCCKIMNMNGLAFHNGSTHWQPSTNRYLFYCWK